MGSMIYIVPACLAKVLALSIGFRAMSVSHKCLYKAVGWKWFGKWIGP